MRIQRLGTLEKLDPEELPPSWMVELAQLGFAMFDVDGKGFMTKEDLRRQLNYVNIRPTEREIDDLYSTIDIDEDPRGIDVHAYTKMLASEVDQDSFMENAETLEGLFNVLSGGNAVMSIEDVQAFLVHIGESERAAEAEHMLNGRGLTQHEFIEFMMP